MSLWHTSVTEKSNEITSILRGLLSQAARDDKQDPQQSDSYLQRLLVRNRRNVRYRPDPDIISELNLIDNTVNAVNDRYAVNLHRHRDILHYKKMREETKKNKIPTLPIKTQTLRADN